MRSSLLIALLCVYDVSAQSTTSTSSNKPDESLIDRPTEGIDYPGCYSDLHKADRNGDGVVKRNEYLNFIQEYGKRICFSTDKLTLQQSATFNSIACICEQQEGTSKDCCLGDNAQIPTDGALTPIADQTPSQKNYLTTVCKLTDATIEGQCPPVVRDRAIPPEALVAPVPAGGNNALMWGLIAAAIAVALLLCCCCCVWRKKQMKQVEEEEEETRIEEGQAAKSLPPQEAAPPVVLGPHLLKKTGIDPVHGPRAMNVDEPEIPVETDGAGVRASGAAVADDDDDEEEARKRRGGGLIPPDDEESGFRIPTAPRLPPPEVPEKEPRALKPIPPKEIELDEWDHPGRDINFPKDKDEMSAGEVDHYEPDGGVNIPQRERGEPLNWKKDWNRQKPEDPDEVDLRKHRIQSGLGEGEVWEKLGQDETEVSKQAPTGDVFDWVVQSALGALGKSDSVGQFSHISTDTNPFYNN